MNTYISEVFSSIQGEGKLVGRRQIFIRFSGCNLDCNYCDTTKSKDPYYGKYTSVDDLFIEIEKLITPDLHSISLTGGEPLLHSDFINEFLNKYNFKTLLETNGSLPSELMKIIDLLHYASVDIKLPEHAAMYEWNDLFDNEIKSINLLIAEGINTYCKIVVLPSTKVNVIDVIASKLADEINDINKLSLIIQPSSPLNKWKENLKLFEFSEKAGNYLDTLIIPQIHKLLKIR